MAVQGCKGGGGGGGHIGIGNLKMFYVLGPACHAVQGCSGNILGTLDIGGWQSKDVRGGGGGHIGIGNLKMFYALGPACHAVQGCCRGMARKDNGHAHKG